jgi:hypothetical protein
MSNKFYVKEDIIFHTKKMPFIFPSFNARTGNMKKDERLG